VGQACCRQRSQVRVPMQKKRVGEIALRLDAKRQKRAYTGRSKGRRPGSICRVLRVMHLSMHQLTNDSGKKKKISPPPPLNIFLQIGEPVGHLYHYHVFFILRSHARLVIDAKRTGAPQKVECRKGGCCLSTSFDVPWRLSQVSPRPGWRKKKDKNHPFTSRRGDWYHVGGRPRKKKRDGDFLTCNKKLQKKTEKTEGRALSSVSTQH